MDNKNLSGKDIFFGLLIGIAGIYVAATWDSNGNKESVQELAIQQQTKEQENKQSEDKKWAEFKAKADAEEAERIATEKAKENSEKSKPENVKFVKNFTHDLKAYINSRTRVWAFKHIEVENVSYQAINLKLKYDDSIKAQGLGPDEAGDLVRFMLKEAQKYGKTPSDGDTAFRVLINSKAQGETTVHEYSLGVVSYNPAFDQIEFTSTEELIRDGVNDFKAKYGITNN